MEKKKNSDLDKTKNVHHHFDVDSVDIKQGLNDEQVKQNRHNFGLNIISGKVKKTWEVVLKELKQPIIILLIIAAIATLAIAIDTVATPGHNGETTIGIIPMFVEPGLIAAIIAFSVSFTVWQEKKIHKAMENISRLTAGKCVVIRNGKKECINAADLVVGDVIVLIPNQIINADAKLAESDNLEVDESILVGSTLINKKDAKFISTPAMTVEERQNYVFSGTKVLGGSGLAVVVAVGNSTQLGILNQALATNNEQLSPLQKQISKLSKILGLIAGCVCLVFFFLYILAVGHYQNFTFGDHHAVESISISISLAVASIPEGLLAIVTVLLTSCVKLMSNRCVLVKKIPYVELLGSINEISFEHHGILDLQEMPIAKIVDLKPKNSSLNYFSALGLLSLTAKNELISKQQINDFLTINQLDLNHLIADYRLVDQKLIANEILAIFKKDDSRESFLIRYYVMDSNFIGQDRHLVKEYNHFLDDHLKVYCLAGAKLDDPEVDLNNLGNIVCHPLAMVGVCNLTDSLQAIKDAGISPIIVTQQSWDEIKDNLLRLNFVTNPEQEVLTSDQLSHLDYQNLHSHLKQYKVFVGMDEENKTRIISVFKNDDNIGVVGGYKSDTEIIKLANVGCVFTSIATMSASDNAKIVVTNNSVSALVAGVKYSREVMLNIKSVLTLLLTANVACLFTTLIGILVFMIQPLCSIQLLVINVLAETVIGFPMASNKRRENVMKFSPYNSNKFIVDKKMAIKIFGFGLLITALSLIMFYIGAASFYHFDYSQMTSTVYGISLSSVDYNQIPEFAKQIWVSNGTINLAVYAGSSLAYVTIGLCLLFNGLSFRTNYSIFTDSFKNTKNMLLTALACFSFIAIVNYIPHLNKVFEADPYAFSQVGNGYEWFNFLPYLCCLFVLGVHEVSKIIVNKKTNAYAYLQKSNTKIKVLNHAN